jgi:hypothetical protein
MPGYSRSSLFILLLALVSQTAADIIGVDFGSNFIKATLVKPG